MVPSLAIAHPQRRIGHKQAFELLALGQPIEAKQALALGLCNRVVPEGDIYETARRIAVSLAERGRSAMRATKHIFVDYAADSLTDSVNKARAFMCRR